MTDLISRADAIEAVRSYFKDRLGKSKCDYDEELQVYVLGKEERTMLTYNKGINDKLRSLPSADAVPIVYCMDCAKSEPLDEHGALWKCKAHDRTTLRHSYCNNGERKGGDTE